jgi:uncharacterized membrane protein YedE/YeeE
MRLVVALLAGSAFGAGLAFADMTNPAKVLNFLDFLGSWDPSLAFVMGVGLAVAAVGFAAARKRPTPFFCDTFELPTRRDLDAELLGGAALFGVGWGLAGFCPGPALAALPLGVPAVYTFVLAMLAGMALYRLVYVRLRVEDSASS